MGKRQIDITGHKSFEGFLVVVFYDGVDRKGTVRMSREKLREVFGVVEGSGRTTRTPKAGVFKMQVDGTFIFTLVDQVSDRLWIRFPQQGAKHRGSHGLGTARMLWKVLQDFGFTAEVESERTKTS